MNMLLLILLGFIAGIALTLIIFRRKKVHHELREVHGDSRAYLQYLCAVVLGAGSDETSREFCKIKHLWEIASTPSEFIAAFQLSDGIAQIAFGDVSEMLDQDILTEIKKTYRIRRNRLLWSIKKTTKDLDISDDSVDKSKRNLLVRYCHMVKTFPKAWEHC
jgi:hypothetical protein